MSKKHMFLNVFSKITLFACVFCAFFISPVFASLPAGYTELEYIESSGTQYIDTGIVINSSNISNVKLELINACAGNNSGSISGISNNNIKLWQGLTAVGAGSADAVIYYSTGNSENGISKKTARTDFYKYVIDTANGIWGMYNLDNSVVYEKNDIVFSTTETGNTKYGLFGFYRDAYFSISSYAQKISSFKATVGGTLVIDLIPARRNSDNVVGMYDLVSNTFKNNSGSGSFIAGPVVEIKIATTKMVDEEFAATEAKLATTVQTIESVVSRTITQTGQIQVLQDTKQTRPDESCPANMKCLLVQDEDGTPHWYPIIEP